MSARPPVPPALRALLETGGALIRRSGTGRALLGRGAGLLGEEGFPRAMRRLPAELAAARAAASEPLGRRDVQRAARGLDSIDDAPVAVTPVGQVHRGELDGRQVAVRIRRPGLEAAVRNDLALLDALAPAVSAVFGALDTGAVLREIRERSLDELDFEHEAATQRAVARALRGVPGIRVPDPFADAGDASVLVAEWVEGPTLAEEAPRDPAAVARALLQAHVRAALAGLAPVDARPNHVVLGDHEVALLGAGNAAAVDRARAGSLLDALAALRADDEGEFARVVTEDLGLLPEAAARSAHVLLRELTGELIEGPARLDEAALAAMGERTIERLGGLIGLAAEATPMPADLWLGRMAAQLVATLAALGATEDWAALALSAR